MTTTVSSNKSRWLVHTERDAGTGRGIRFDTLLSSSGCSDVERNVINRVTRRYQQLQTDLTSNTSAIPSLTFIYDRSSLRWSVALVGSGGVYGSASTRQIVLAPAGMSLRETLSVTSAVLSAGPFLEEIALSKASAHYRDVTPAPFPQSPLRPITSPQSDIVVTQPAIVSPEDVCDVVANVLTMSESHPFACADIAELSPLESLAVIAQVLPEELSRSARWSTAYLCVDKHRSHRVVTCSWSSELIARHPDVHGSVLGSARWSSSGLKEETEALRWFVASCLERCDIAVRDKIEQAYSDYFMSLTHDIGWSEMSSELVSIISCAMPLSDSDAALVVTGRHADGTSGTQQEIDVLIRRWNDEDTVRFAWRHPNSIGLLIAGPTTPETVTSSTLRLCKPPEFGGERTIWDALVSWQCQVLKSGDTPVAKVRTLSHPEQLARDVLASLRQSEPHNSHGVSAENWIDAIGLDSADYDDLLPLTRNQVIRKLTRDASDPSPFAQYCHTMDYDEVDILQLAHDLTQAVPGSLAAILRQLPDLGVPPAMLIRKLLLDVNEDDSILSFLRRMEASISGSDCENIRADIVDAVFASGLFRLAISDNLSTAEAILAFERSVPLPPTSTADDSAEAAGDDEDTFSSPEHLMLPRSTNRIPRRDDIRDCVLMSRLDGLRDHFLLALSLGVNVLLMSIVVYVLY